MEAEAQVEAPRPKGHRKLLVVIVAIVIVAAVVGVVLFLYVGGGTLRVQTTSSFVNAGSSTAFTAVATTPPLVSVGTLNWQFGDGATVAASAMNTTHTYGFPGTFFVGVSSTMSNGNAISNFDGLLPIQVGLPVTAQSALGTTASYGLLSINTTQSSPGAPVIATGGHIAVSGVVQAAPTFFYAEETNPSNNTWENFTWQAVSMSLDFGDGSSAQTTTDVSGPFQATHTYSQAGLFALTLTVTTQNYSAVQYDGSPASPTPVPVSPAQTVSTKVGQTVAVGSYALVTYGGNVLNPGVITYMKAHGISWTTLDPDLDYETTGAEIIANIYETLVKYDGTSTDNFVPVVADSVPTVGNGISSDFLTFTFHIRQNLKFSDGTAVTPYDVKYSITRDLLFVSGSPGTPGWELAQFLLPTNSDGSWNLSYSAVNGAISIDDTAQTVTFHLVSPAVPLLFLQILAASQGGAIVSHTWLESSGPKLEWSDAGFAAYEPYGNQPDYVEGWRNAGVGSGPYMIDYIAQPDAVVLKANPYFTPLTGVPAPAVPRVVIEYVTDDSTRELSLQSGQADIAGIPTTHFNTALTLKQNGLVNIQFFPTLNLFFWNINTNIYQSKVGPNSNPYGNQVPSDFFMDVNMRKAFFYAYNFQQYIDSIVGNKVYNANFGQLYGGIIPNGMAGYQNLSGLDKYDMTLAHQYYNQTQWVKDRGWANSGFTLAINVDVVDSIAKAAAAMWAQSLDQLAPNVHVVVAPISAEEGSANTVPDGNPMALYSLDYGWLPDYPFPTDYTVGMLLPGTAQSPYGGYYTAGNGFNISYFQGDANGTNQVANLTAMLNWIRDSINPPNSTNVDAVIQDSQMAQNEEMNLSMYVPEMQQYAYFTYRTWMSGFDEETNPMLAGAVILFNVLTKGSGSTTASSLGAQSGASSPLATLAFASPLAAMAWLAPAVRRDPGEPAEGPDAGGAPGQRPLPAAMAGTDPAGRSGSETGDGGPGGEAKV